MRARIGKALGIAALAFSVVSAGWAQVGTGDWGFQCIDPANNTPRSDDHAFTGIGNSLWRVHIGVSGTTTYGGQNGPCYGPTAVTLNLRGRFGFMVGDTGSVQDENPADPGNANFRDDSLILTTGMPFDPGGAYVYATTNRGTARTMFGANDFSLFFVGSSDRYFIAETTNDNVFVQLRVDLVGDAARYQWTLTNLADTTENLGIWFGASLGMLTNPDDGVVDRNGANQSHHRLFTLTRGGSSKDGYVTLPSGRPPLTEQRFNRSLNPADFPQVVDFWFGQSTPFGLRVENGATESTVGVTGQSDAAEVSEFALGNAHPFLLGVPGANPATFSDVTIGDIDFLDNTGFIQKFTPRPVAGGQQTQFIHYVRSPWSVANYALPYAAVVDAPQLVAVEPTGLNGVTPNPMTIRVYVDNTGGYSTVNQTVSLNNVQVRLTLPEGLSAAPGQSLERTITVVPPQQIRFVDFLVESDGITNGNLPYNVTINSTPGGSKNLNGIIRVATTPRLQINQDANLVTSPWNFQDTSWEAVLGLDSPTQFQAFRWDATQQGYLPATSVERGVGTWIISSSDEGSVALAGNPQLPADTSEGAPLLQLKSGWNLIGNPYPYPVPLGQLVGVSAANPARSFTWTQLVAQGVVSGSLAYYDNATGDYVFIQGADELIMPNRGYWLFVATLQDVTLSFPPVFAAGLPGSTRSNGVRWTQSDQQWRLQLSARTANSQDASNFVGVARTADLAKQFRTMDPPSAPEADVSLGIVESQSGKTTRLAQSLVAGSNRNQWKVAVTTTGEGEVTLNWPNLSTVPKNVRFRLTDLATGQVRDLRQTSGYTFTATGAGTREFSLEMLPGGASRAVIGNVVVSRPSRDALAPFTVQYTLSGEASTTVRILSGAGREVFTAARGRADKAGQNSVTWALRDNANRLVAPGTYRVEIVAETANGERVRKVIPLNVIR